MTPYYYDEKDRKFIKHPLHYILFSQFKWYRKLIGGKWNHFKDVIWMRMK